MLSRLPRFSTHNVSAYRRHIVAYNWTIVVASTIASFIPLFMYGQQWAGGFPAGKFGYLNKFTKPPLTNAQLYAYTGNNYQIDTTTRNTVDSVYMGMAIPTALDLLLELYAEWTAEKGQESMHVVRLSWVERAVFVLGVFFYGSVYLFPQGWNIMARDNMNYAFESASTILTTGPILIFLERTTAAFPPIFTAVVLTVLCAGCVVESSLVLTLTKADFLYMNSIAQPLVYVPCALIVMACVWCFINYVRGSGYMRVDGDAAKHQLNAQSDTYRDFCTNKVPGYHMVSLAVASLVTIVWYTTTGQNNNVTQIFQILSTALVFVIEMRIRQSEVKEGLHMLESKKLFVRFLAHEIRTPMSTASMGLDLFNLGFVGWEPASVDDPMSSSFMELQEYLAMVQESIRAVESIFDNLIEVDLHGQEKETLVLNFEATDASVLLKSVMMPLQVHARRSEMDLRMTSSGGATPCNVNVDRRRIAQVLRALLATAISATEKKGEVTVTVRPAADVTTPAGGSEGSTGPRRSSWLARLTKSTKSTKSESSVRVDSLREKPTPSLQPSFFRTRTLSSNFNESDALARFVVVEINHGGLGFAPENATQVNHDTFTFNPNEIHGGGGVGGGTQSGLGLYLAKLIVEAHGGKVFVTSKGVGRGSTFVLGLPIGAAAVPMSHAAEGIVEAVPARPSRPLDSASLGPYVEVVGGPPARAPAVAVAEEQGGDGTAALSTVPFANAPTSTVDAAAKVGTSDPLDRVDHAVPTKNDMLAVPAAAAAAAAAAADAATTDRELFAPSPAPAAGVRLPPLVAPLVADGADAADGDDAGVKAATVAQAEGLYILVVEDAPVARTMLVKLLKTMKCTADEAEDGQQAVGKVRAALADPSARLYDMILCDSVMPVMDGPTAVQIIRGLGYDGPILGVTGNTLPEQIEDFMQHGADEVVGKPVKLPVLKNAMTHWRIVKETGAARKG